MLDPGHSDKKPGALGARGIYEVHYNDLLVYEIIDELSDDSTIEVLLTRQKGGEVSLSERVIKANESGVSLYLSIHHDSTSSDKLTETIVGGRRALKTRSPISGYSIFISQENPKILASIDAALQLGRQMENINRLPSAHRVYMSKTENRRLMNRRYGIYQFDRLAVLRGVNMPAVLFEIGFIVDEADEQYVTNSRRLIARQIARALRRIAQLETFSE